MFLFRYFVFVAILCFGRFVCVLSSLVNVVVELVSAGFVLRWWCAFCILVWGWWCFYVRCAVVGVSLGYCRGGFWRRICRDRIILLGIGSLKGFFVDRSRFCLGRWYSFIRVSFFNRGFWTVCVSRWKVWVYLFV